VYVYDNGSLNYQASFPIAVITGQSPTITRIDQVFNGFGYIGSTVFALPGVKGLIPNGRNADGTLNSQEFTVNTVLTTTDVSSATGGLEYYVSDLGINRVNFGQYTYNEQKNKTLDSSGNRIVAVLLDANAHRTSGKVDSFNTRAVFHAVDYFDIVKYSDKKTVVGWGMPDYSAAVSISLPYTPTKDGYILRNVQNGYIHLRLTQSLVSYAGADNRFNSTMIPVSSGQTVSEYLSGGTYEMYFIPCKGE